MSSSSAIDSQDFPRPELPERVAAIIEAVRRRGDEAVQEFERRRGDEAVQEFERRRGDEAVQEFERRRGDLAAQDVQRRHDAPTRLPVRISDDEIERCVGALPGAMLDDIRFLQHQARRVAEAQRTSIRNVEIDTRPGVRYGLRHVPVSAAGICVAPASRPVPGAADASVITARTAGVPRVAACVPLADGRLPALFIAALHIAGVDEIYAVGGVHGLAALALGTETIDRVDVVVGSGDAAMAEANRQLFGGRAVELAEQTSEILIIADDSADPETVAADLLGAIERDPEGHAVLITVSPALGALVLDALERQLDALPFSDVAALAWHRHGAINVVDGREHACALADRYGFDNVNVLTADPRWYLGRLRRCETLQLGHQTTSAFPGGMGGRQTRRRGAASQGPGLSVTSFLNTVAYEECLDAESARLTNEVVARQWRLSGFEARARACELRTLPASAAIVAGSEPRVAALPSG